MLTAKQIKELPKGFTPIIRTSKQSYGKSKKYRTGTQCRKVYQTLPSGKRILRLEETVDRAILKGFKKVHVIKGNRYSSIKEEKKS